MRKGGTYFLPQCGHGTRWSCSSAVYVGGGSGFPSFTASVTSLADRIAFLKADDFAFQSVFTFFSSPLEADVTTPASSGARAFFMSKTFRFLLFVQTETCLSRRETIKFRPQFGHGARSIVGTVPSSPSSSDSDGPPCSGRMVASSGTEGRSVVVCCRHCRAEGSSAFGVLAVLEAEGRRLRRGERLSCTSSPLLPRGAPQSSQKCDPSLLAKEQLLQTPEGGGGGGGVFSTGASPPPQSWQNFPPSQICPQAVQATIAGAA